MKKLILLFSLVIPVSIITAQGGGSVGVADAVSAGMANSYTAVSRGIFCIGKNPANLIYLPENQLEFSTVLPIPNVNIFGGSNFISIEEYNYYFGGVDDGSGNTIGRFLTEQDKNNLRDLFQNGGIVAVDAAVNYLNVVYKPDNDIGAFGFSINDYASGYINLPRGLINLAITGNPVGKIYNFGGSDLKASWLRDFSLSYSRQINTLFEDYLDLFAVGVTLKYVQGFAMIETDHIRTTLGTGAQNVITSQGDVLGYSAFSDDFGIEYDFDSTGIKKDGSFSIFPTPAGTGFGFDIGFTAKVNEIWTLGLACTDIGFVKWTENVAEYSSNHALVIDDITDDVSRDSVLNNVTGEGKFIDYYTSSLSTALRLGVSFQLDKSELVKAFPGTLLITLDYNQGFNNLARNSTKPRFSIGAEWRPDEIVPIRTGFSIGGRDGFSWAFGTGVNLDILEFNIAASNFGRWLTPNVSRKFTVSIGTLWRI